MRNAEEKAKAVEGVFKAVDREMQTDVWKWFARFAENNEISLPDAKRLLTGDELAEFRWTVEEYLKHAEENGLDAQWTKQLENASARYHISRLESLRTQLRQYAETVYGKQLQTLESLLSDTYAESYNRTLYTLGQGTGASLSFQNFDENALAKILQRPWTTDDKTFRDRCWTNKTALIGNLQTVLAQGIAAGTEPRVLTDKLSRAMQVSSYKAGRLVMTESAYFAAEARRDCFKALEVERYEIIGTLDTSTCSACGGLDGRVFRQADYEPGVTAPPFHPNCRCTTAPYFDDWEELGAAPSRAARDENNRTVQVRDMTYEEWREQTSEAVQEYRKIETEEQSAVPGDALEKSLVRYRTAAYAERNAKENDDTKKIVSLVSTKAEKYDKLILQKVLGININDVTITEIAEHVIERMNDRKVSIDDIINALENPLDIKPIKYDSEGRPSFTVVGAKATVSVNPETGKLTTTYPTHSKIAERLKAKKEVEK